MSENEQPDVTSNSLVIPLFSSLYSVMDLCSPVRKAYGKVFTVRGEAYTTRSTGLWRKSISFIQIVDDVKGTHLSCATVWTRLTSSERSRPGLKSAYQPVPWVTNSGHTSSAFACAHSSVEGSESGGGRTSFSDSAGATSPSLCLVCVCSNFRLRTSALSKIKMSTRCG